MIKIENINITYDRPLIIDGTLELPANAITVLKGQSGIGKTSLLNVVGLLTMPKGVHYQFFDTVIEDNEKVKALYRKEHIGYVLQENHLFNHLSIFENLKLYRSMIKSQLTKEDAQQLLNSVNLDKPLSTKVTLLSGGERQRLAIACVLAKKPKLLILDEPTSALDEKNAQIIIDVLKHLAQLGLTILIASHDKRVIEQGDVIYKIENQKLIKETEIASSASGHLVTKNIALGLGFYFNYYMQYFKQNFKFQMSIILILGVVFASLLTLPVIYQDIQYNLEVVDHSYMNKEFYVTNTSSYKNYSSDLPIIDDWKIERIEKIREVSALYPFFESSGSNLTLNCKTYPTDFVVQPYAPEKDITKSLAYQVSSNQNEIYLSEALASKLKINENDATCQISFSHTMPNSQTYFLDHMNVSGVLDDEKLNHYSNENKIIYVPYEKLPTLETTNALIGYVSEEMYGTSISGFIHYIDATLAVDNHLANLVVGNYEVQTIMEAFAPMMMIGLGLIGVLMIALIYIKHIQNRQLEINLLKINGLHKGEVMRLVIAELLMQTVIISCFALGVVVIIYPWIKSMLSVRIYMDYLDTTIKCFACVFAFMFIPSILALISFQRSDMATLLRKDS